MDVEAVEKSDMKNLFSKIVIAMVIAAGAVIPSVAQADAAEVYVYRKDRDFYVYSFIFTKRLPVWFADASGRIEDKRTLASLKQGRYFKLSLPPGTYFFDTRHFSGSTKIELAAGERRFLRLDHGTRCGTADDNSPGWEAGGCTSKSPYIEVMPETDALAHFAHLKPIDKGDVKERNFVTIPTAPPGK